MLVDLREFLAGVVAIATGHEDLDLGNASQTRVTSVVHLDAVQVVLLAQIDLPPRVFLAAGNVKAPQPILDSITSSGGILSGRYCRGTRRSGRQMIPGGKTAIPVDPIGLDQLFERRADINRRWRLDVGRIVGALVFGC